MTRNDFKKLARARLKEAKILLASGEHSGAYYLAGYVIECALKACIAKQTQRYEFPDKKRVEDSWRHELTKLVITAGLQTLLDEQIRADARFAASWNVTKDWSEQSRYYEIDQKKAESLVEAISDDEHGVLKWLRLHW